LKQLKQLQMKQLKQLQKVKQTVRRILQTNIELVVQNVKLVMGHEYKYKNIMSIKKKALYFIFSLKKSQRKSKEKQKTKTKTNVWYCPIQSQ